jgi:hypothetical protein
LNWLSSELAEKEKLIKKGNKTMARRISKASQLDMAQRDVAFYFENIMWREYVVEEMTNAGGYFQTEFTDNHVMLSIYSLKPAYRDNRYPSAEGLNETIVEYNKNYLEALERCKKYT